MPEVEIEIGGRSYTVACQDGEETYLRAAAKMLDTEATVVLGQIGRMPSDRMLLMAGLMLADKTASMEDRVNEVQGALAERDSQLEQLRSTPAPEPERVEVPVVPQSVTEAMAELAARAEAIAAQIEDKAQG